MRKFRICVAVLALLTGIIMFIVRGLDAQWFGAMSFLVGGFITAFITCIGVIESLNSSLVRFGAGLLTVLAIGTFFFEERGVDYRVHAAHFEVFSRLLEVPFRCEHRSQEFDSVISFGIKQCNTQGIEDMQRALMNFQKSKYLDPATGFVESTLSSSNQHTDKCAFAFREASKFCPDLFDDFEVQYLKVLQAAR
ncbi:hypothetical protein AAOGI_33860 [Agarivorans albus]